MEYIEIKEKDCCSEVSGKVYQIPVGATLHEIATITGVSISKAIEIENYILNKDCSTTIFYNIEISESVKKNNCTQGTGSTVTITVPAGMFSSQISQIDADTKARNYFNLNAQSIANSQGSCIEEECLDCNSYRVVETTDCGEYRYNTKCIDGICTDISSRYFVCTGNCKGETCIEECITCSLTCPTGECPEGYNCINGNCIKDCTNQPCSYECPEGDTGDICTECINGIETSINCPFGTKCVGGNCCTDENQIISSYPCCPGLFEFEGRCISQCPENYEFTNGTCLVAELCGNTSPVNITSDTPTNIKGEIVAENTVVKVVSQSLSSAHQKIRVLANNTQILYESDCVDNDTFFFAPALNDNITIEVTPNCNSGAPTNGIYSTLTRSCRYVPIQPTLEVGENRTYNIEQKNIGEVFTLNYILKANSFVALSFVPFTGRNRLIIYINDELVSDDITTPTTNKILKNFQSIQKGDLLSINVYPYGTPLEIDGTSNTGDPVNKSELVIMLANES